MSRKIPSILATGIALSMLTLSLPANAVSYGSYETSCAYSNKKLGAKGTGSSGVVTYKAPGKTLVVNSGTIKQSAKVLGTSSTGSWLVSGSKATSGSSYCS